MNKKKPIQILHSAALLRPPSGILNQMVWEQQAAIELDLAWDVVMYCPNNSAIKNQTIQFDNTIDINTKNQAPHQKIKAWYSLRKNYHAWLMSVVDKYDIFILRYYVHDPFQQWFIRRCAKPVFLLHHTLEVPELAMPKNTTAFLRSSLEAYIAKKTLKYAKGIIGVTDEIVKYELKRTSQETKPNCVYPNGIVYREIEFIDHRSKGIPEILFVANFLPWHGIDILLESIKKNTSEFILHIVGKLPPEINKKDLIDKRIIKHGILKHEEIIVLSQRCWIGLSTLALKRKKMNQACTLKVREYLMLGMAVYGDHQDVFPENFPYIKKGSGNIVEILEYAKKTRAYTKESISKSSMKYIDKKELLLGLKSFIESQV